MRACEQPEGQGPWMGRRQILPFHSLQRYLRKNSNDVFSFIFFNVITDIYETLYFFFFIKKSDRLE